MIVEQALELALSHHKAGQLTQAEHVCRQILAQQPDHPTALYQLGMVMVAMGRHETALELVQKAVARQPATAACLCNLGVLYRLRGRWDEAAACYREALTIQPDLAEAYANLGEVCGMLGRHDEAIACYRRALKIQPRDAETHNNLGNALRSTGRTAEALACLQRALELKPDYPEALYNLGSLYFEESRWEEAIPYLQRALALKPGFVEALSNLGSALTKAGRPKEAVACFRRAIELKPQYAAAHCNLGNALSAENHVDEAILSYQRALALDGNYAEAHSNLGATYLHTGQLDEAIACCQRAVTLKPDLADGHWNLSVGLLRQGRFDEAEQCCRQAIARKADFPAPHLNLGLILLLRGQYEEGWREYEWGPRAPEGSHPTEDFHVPRWNGTSADGKTILVYAEQGLGDALQFARYLPLVKQHSGARQVVFACQPELVRLLVETGGWDALVIPRSTGDSTTLPAFDQQVPLFSLPLALGVFPPLTISGQYMRSNPDLRATWKAKMPAARDLRIGLAWRGNPAHENDRNRSLEPDAFLPLFKIAGLTFYSLQVQPGSAAPASLQEAGLVDFTVDIRDFADSAALMAELDLIITVDTATAHLAGALGRPVWTLLPFIPDWRWGLEREDTPWYPTMRLFRQPAPGGWAHVIQRLVEELRRAVAAGAVGSSQSAC